jgi:hypothetical protein
VGRGKEIAFTPGIHGAPHTNYLAFYPRYTHCLHSMDGNPRGNIFRAPGILQKAKQYRENPAAAEILLPVYLRILFQLLRDGAIAFYCEVPIAV